MLHSQSPFAFFESDHQKTAVFIDGKDSRRTATPVRHHPELAHHVGADRVFEDLFVPREIVEPLTKAIRAADPRGSRKAA